MKKQDDPIKSLTIKGLAKAKLLTPQEELVLADKCRKAKVETWNQILSELDSVSSTIKYAKSRMNRKALDALDESAFPTLFRRVAALQRKRSNYRIDMWNQARYEVACAFSNADVCLRIGREFMRDMGEGKFKAEPEWKKRVEESWKRFVRYRNEFIEKNMRLVIKIAKRYRGFNIPFEDLIQEGTFGLERAVDLFDPDKGFKFSTYASWWIRASIQRYCRDKGRIVRIPVHMQEAHEKYKDIIDSERCSDMQEIAEVMGISVNKVKTLEKMDMTSCFSLDAKVYGPEGNSSLGDTIASDDLEFRIADVNIDMEMIHEIIESLPFRKKYIIECRFGLNDGEPQTLQEIANEFGMSRERIRQLQVSAMDEIRRRINRKRMPVQDEMR